MSVENEQECDVVIVVPEPCFCDAWIRSLEAELTQIVDGKTWKCLLDAELLGVASIDVIDTLTDTTKAMEANGGAFYVCNLSLDDKELLEALAQSLRLYRTRDEALKALREL